MILSSLSQLWSMFVVSFKDVIVEKSNTVLTEDGDNANLPIGKLCSFS
jgi:hypothetical protein